MNQVPINSHEQAAQGGYFRNIFSGVRNAMQNRMQFVPNLANFGNPNYASNELIVYPPPRRVANLWTYPLINSNEICSYVGFVVCPGMSFYDTARSLIDKHRLSQSRTESFDSCYACVASAIVDVPLVFSCDRAGHRVKDRYFQSNSNNADEEYDEHDLSRNYSNKNRRSRTFFEKVNALLNSTEPGENYENEGENAHFLHDRKGFDIENASEDWWPFYWCCFYTKQATSEILCLKFGDNNTKFTPLCFTCLCGMIYPLATCPVTFILRRMLIEDKRLSEPCIETCALSLFCAPCAMTQTFRESEMYNLQNSSQMASTLPPNQHNFMQ